MKDISPTRVDHLLEGWGSVTPAQKALTFKRIHSAGINPNDAMAVIIAVYVMMETCLDDRLNQMSLISDQVGRAAFDEYRNFQRLWQDEQIRQAHEISKVVERALSQDLPNFARQQTLRVAQQSALAAVCLGMLLVGGSYWLGTTHTKQKAVEYAAFAARSDAGSWKRLQAANPDLNFLLAEYCLPGARGYSAPTNSRPASCQLPVWLNTPRPTTELNWLDRIKSWTTGQVNRLRVTVLKP
ncbi:MAG: hypothetical protein VX974_03605 [Pseudomonadota bacterium]|nr:hypothetical protein [Pseudomonadota bacterium]